MGLGRWINRALARFGWKVVRLPTGAAQSIYDQDGLTTRHNHDFLNEARFRQAYARGVQAAGSDYGWHWRVRVGLWTAASAAKLDGDFVECGVNRGFLSSAILQYLHWNQRQNDFYLLDTFAGLDPQFIRDQNEAAANARHLHSGFYTKTIAPVQANFAQWDRVHIIQGSIPDSLENVPSRRIAYLHIDLNCSPPEVAALSFFWPRLLPGAFVLFDDYAYAGFENQKEPIDAFARERGLEVLPLPTGQGLLIAPPKREI